MEKIFFVHVCSRIGNASFIKNYVFVNNANYTNNSYNIICITSNNHIYFLAVEICLKNCELVTLCLQECFSGEVPEQTYLMFTHEIQYMYKFCHRKRSISTDISPIFCVLLGPVK